MKRRIFTQIYAILCAVGLLAGIVAVFAFAWRAGITPTIGCLIGLFLSFLLAPTFHELGHVALACRAKMELVYTKFFCFTIWRKGGKLRFGLASPFAADQTQMVPKSGGDMPRRAAKYTLGGLLFSIVLLVLIGVACLVVWRWEISRYFVLSILPYTAYLFLLNVLPCEYASGKTDMAVYAGIRKQQGAEKVMLSAMEIQGRLYQGESYAEIDEELYVDLPQLCEDEPLFAVMQDLRYRYYLEKGEMEKAADALNRLAQAQAYLSDYETERIAAELVYMHSLLGNIEQAEDSGRLCKGFLQGDSVTAKRILAAFSKAAGKQDAVEPLLQQAEEAMAEERCLGVRKFERILLSRILSV